MFTIDAEMESYIKKTTPRNLVFFLYKEEEAGFLAGIFAGLITKDFYTITNRLNPNNIIGIIIANKTDSKFRYEFGFKLGVLAVNEDCKILYNQLEDELDYYLIRKYTSNLYSNGADIVFQLCGRGGPSAIQAAYLSGNFIIGYEVDQNIFAPRNVITSAIKKVSSSIYYYLKKSFLLGFFSGLLRLGIKDGAVGLASFYEFDLLIPQKIKDAIYLASTSIAEGKISIPFVSLTLKEDDINEKVDIDNNTNLEENQEENLEDNSEENSEYNSEDNSEENIENIEE